MAYPNNRTDSDATLWQANASQPQLKSNTGFHTHFNDDRDASAYHDDPQSPLPQPRPQFAQSRTAERVSFAPPKSTGDLRLWRHDERGNVWTKGGKGKAALRFCCCTLFMTVFLIISIVLALAMWARPPDIAFNGIQLPTDSSAVSVQQNSLDINLGLSISVKNPNFFGASFKSIVAQAFYPPLTAQLGGGALYNIDFPSNSETQFLFPLNITYSMSIDPQNILVSDLVTKCGIKAGSTKSPLTIKYDLKLALRIIAITISPSFSGTADFDCPVTRADLQSLGGDALLKSLGVE